MGREIVMDNRENKIKKKITKIRKVYTEKSKYTDEMKSVFSQKWNLKDNDIIHKLPKRGTDFIIEYMALYKEMIENYPDQFHNNDKLIKSIQESIECSCDSRLLKSYIQKLINDDSCSFLLIPIMYKTLKKNLTSEYKELGCHNVSAIIQKENNKIKVKICDKGGEYDINCEKEVFVNKKCGQIKPIYVYEFEQRHEIISKISDIFCVGRGHFSWRTLQVLMTNRENSIYYPLREFETWSIKSYYTNQVSAVQLMGNCGVKNLSFALKYLLGERYQITINDKIYYKNKSKVLWDKQLIDIITNKVKDDNFTKILEQEYATYLKLKNDRSLFSEEKKIRVKYAKGKELSAKQKNINEGRYTKMAQNEASMRR